MTTSDTQTPRSQKRNQQIVAAALWLLTVALGLLAIPAVIRGVDTQVLNYIFERMQSEEMGPITASQLSRAANLVTILITGALWMGGVLFGGFGFHSKRVGQRSSYRVFGWTIGIELTLILIGTLLQGI